MTNDTPTETPEMPQEAVHEFLGEAKTPVHPAAETRAEARAETRAAQPGGLIAAMVILALVVVIGGYLLWRNSSGSAEQVAQLQDQLSALQLRLQTLEARPAPPPPPPPPNLAPIEQRLTTLEQKPPPVAQLDAAGQQQIAAVSSRIDGVAARQNQLGTTEQTDIAKLNDQIAALTSHSNDQIADLNSRMAAVTKAGSAISALADRQARTARLQMANVALQSGKPLGEIPSAPPALAQFATKAPPTEASLRLSFDQAAEAAHAAGQPPKDSTPFLTRVWDRAQSGFTIRQGDHILVGDAVAGVLAHARVLLDAGDLPGAVAALDGLTGAAATAMAPWRAQAQSLLDARAALITAANG